MTLNVLLVENDKLDQTAFTRVVKREALPYEYHIAETVREGRALLQAQPFDVALVDYHLPDGTGFDILGAVPANVAVIFITGAGSEETAIMALRAGASDYLIKDPDRIYLKFLPLTIERAVHQKQTERQLWTLSQAVMSSSESIYVTDKSDRITHVNGAFCDTYGYEPEEIIGRTSLSLLARDSVPTVYAGTRELESVHQRRDGSRFPVAMSRSPVNDDQGVPFAYVAVVRDFSERRRAELALRASEERYRSVVTSMAEGVILQDREGRIQACNRSAERILGLTMKQLVERSVGELGWRAIHEDGTPFARENDPTLVTFRTGEAQHQVIMGVQMPDEVIRWIVVNTEPLWQKGENRPYAVVSSMTDITQLKDIIAERDQLIQNLDSFAHTVAHDLKGPAGVVVGYASLLAADFEAMTGEELLEALQRMEAAAQRTIQIIDALLLLAGASGGEEVPLAVLDMPAIAAEAKDRLQHLIDDSGAAVTVATKFPLVLGYAPWVEEMLVNYLSNALKYGGRPARVEIGSDTSANGMVRIWVRDNGQGLTPAEQKQLFRPFTRVTRAAIDGHGLGLSIVKQIAERLGGSVRVSSKVGRGSEFSFTLPAFAGEPVPRREPAQNNGRVLAR